MVLGLLAAVAIGIIVAIIKDDRKQKKKADLEAGGSRHRKIDTIRSKISAVTQKLKRSEDPESTKEYEQRLTLLEEELAMLIREDYNNNKCRKVVPYHGAQQTPPPTPTAPRRELSRGIQSGEGPSIPEQDLSWSPGTSRRLESSIAQMARAVGRSAERTEMALTMMSSSLSDQRAHIREMRLSINRLSQEPHRPSIQRTDSVSERECTQSWDQTPGSPKYRSTPVRDTTLADMVREQSELLDAGGFSRCPSAPMLGSTSMLTSEMRDLAASKMRNTCP
jgi:hypothetical protein